MPSSRDAIDLNADVGEGLDDGPLYRIASSANIACGGHAGNARSMREAVESALRHGVSIGAHPSYPDREGFGRVSVDLPPRELSRAVAEQVDALVRVASDAGATLRHVKPHGALYNDAARRGDIAAAIADGVSEAGAPLVLVGLAGSHALDVWQDRGFQIAAEGFADRAYEPDGTLRPRSRPGALIDDPVAAAAQAVRLARTGRCRTLCVHGDTPGAEAIARAVRLAIEAAGFVLRGL